MSSIQTEPSLTFQPCLSDNPSGIAVVVLDSIFLVLSALAISIRLYGRHAQRTGLFFNDYAVLIAWPLTAGLVVSGILAVCPGGGGHHISEVDPKEIPGTLKGYIAAEILWAAANVSIKLSLLHLYKQLFGPNKTFCYVVYMVMAFVVAFAISVVLIPFGICQPFARNWDPLLPGHCGNIVASITATSAINVTVDLTIITLPMPLIWRLQTTRDRKLSLTIVFSLGLIVCAITLLRLVTSVDTEISDFTWRLAKLAIYSDMEPLLGMIVACLPLFPVAFQHLLQKDKHGSSGNALVESITRWRTKYIGSSGRRRHDNSILLTDITDNNLEHHPERSEGHFDSLPVRSVIKVEQGWEVTSDK